MSDTLAPRMRVSVRARPWTEAELQKYAAHGEGVQARAHAARTLAPRSAFDRRAADTHAAAVAPRWRCRAAALRQSARGPIQRPAAAPPALFAARRRRDYAF